MSKYKISLFVIIPIVTLAIVIYGILFAVGIILVYLLILAVMAFVIQSNFYLKSINRATTEKQNIVLSFDDGPVESTPLLLDILKGYNAKAIFFCIGSKIEGNESVLQRMIDEGHIVANHSLSHSVWFDFYSSKKIAAEIEQTNELLFKAIGKRSKLFRPPYGVTNPMIADAIKKLGVQSIGWSKRSLDTVLRDTQRILNRISPNIRPGDIVLMHDAAPNCTEVLKKYLQYIDKKGYKTERLDKIIKIDCYEN